jgi:PAS domain S-box-containing protein
MSSTSEPPTRWARLRQSLRPPYSLSTQLLLTLSAMTVIIVVANGVVAYQRISRETMERATAAANAIAGLVASSNTDALITNDIAAIESSLLQVVRLPLVEGIAVLRGDGRPLVAVRQDGEKVRSEIGGTRPSMTASPPPLARTGRVEGDRYATWESIPLRSERPLGWVRVDISLMQRAEELERLWRRSVNTLLATIAAILLVLPLLLHRSLRPLRQLSTLAGHLSDQIGQRVEIQSSSLEAHRLSEALNQASHDVAKQVARTQVIVNTAAMAIIGLDVEGCVVTANPATTSIFGREESELQGLPLEQCIPGLGVDMLRSLFGELEDSPNRPYRIVRQDFFGTRMDGTLFPIEISLGQAPLTTGLRYVCIVRDVTDERAMQETSELYERALASSHNGVFITNASLASQPIVFVNDAFQKITGLAPHQILGRGMEQLLTNVAASDALSALLDAMREQRSTSVELQLRLVHGREITTEISLSPVRAGQGTLTHYIGIVSDVTARVQAEQAIAERGAQLDAIFSLSPDGFVLFDADGYLIFANPAFERMTGKIWSRPGLPVTIEEFGHSLAALCHPDHPMPPLLESCADKEPWRARLVLARPQHRVVLAQSRRNVAGRSETIFYFRDVTHEDEVDRMKSEFLASAAHELRTPMVSIFGFTELLLRRKFSEERQADMLQTIHRQSGLLVKMINELLDLARIESRRGLDLNIAPHPLRELVQHSVKGLMLKDTDRQVSVDIIPDVQVLIDPEKMQLALNNVLSNAFKYSPDGGQVRLSVQVRPRNGSDHAVLAVSDQGIGMKPEQLTRAFERFYRADTTGNIPGTGLGLSLVKEIAELHHGSVEIESEFGVGTTVRLWLPLTTEVAIPATPAG